MLAKLQAAIHFFSASTRGYRLRPWRSPYLRWRIETYWGWPADKIDARGFLSFSWRQRRPRVRFLGWAADMGSNERHRLDA